MKKFIAVIALILMVGAIMACAPAAAPTSAPAPTSASATSAPAPTSAPATSAGATTAPAPTAATSGKKLTFAMVTDQNGLGDQGFNDISWAGLQKAAKDFNGEAKVVESTEQAQYVPNLTSLAKANTDLTVGVGFLLVDAMQQVASANPNAKFALVDATVDAPNVLGLVFREQEGSFLGGVVAGLTTKSNTIGVIGGLEIPPVIRWISGFQAGVKTVNPNAKVLVSYVGSFGDPAKGKEIAISEMNQGADVLFEVGGGSGIGVWQAAKEKGSGVWVFGTDRCKYSLAPDNALPDVVKRVDVAVYDAAQAVAEGTFKGGPSSLGLKENGMGLCDETYNKLPDTIKAQVEKAKNMIVAGTLVPPSTKDELDKFIPPSLK